MIIELCEKDLHLIINGAELRITTAEASVLIRRLPVIEDNDESVTL